MDRDELLHYVAPCSLFCYTCLAFKDGAVPELAGKLCNYFEGYYEFNDANLPEQYRSWLGEFEAFYKRLEQYTKRPCHGCRNDPALKRGCIEGCVVPACVKDHNVDFCAECPEFPCQKAKTFFSTVNDTIGTGWENGSERLKQIGLEAYFNEKKDISHYIKFKKQEETV